MSESKSALYALKAAPGVCACINWLCCFFALLFERHLIVSTLPLRGNQYNGSEKKPQCNVNSGSILNLFFSYKNQSPFPQKELDSKIRFWLEFVTNVTIKPQWQRSVSLPWGEIRFKCSARLLMTCWNKSFCSKAPCGLLHRTDRLTPPRSARPATPILFKGLSDSLIP